MSSGVESDVLFAGGRIAMNVMKWILVIGDTVAVLLCFLAFFFLFAVGMYYAVVGVWKEVAHSWSSFADRILIVMVLASFVWCVVRRRQLTEHS